MASNTARIAKVYWLVMLASLGGFAGCGAREEGPLHAGVSGEVTLDGNPLNRGVIRFIPQGETTGPKVTVNITEGVFWVDADNGPVVGQHRIEIESLDDGGYAPDDEDAFKRIHEQGIKKVDVITVPPQYNSRSMLTETVSAEAENDYRFELFTKTPKK